MRGKTEVRASDRATELAAEINAILKTDAIKMGNDPKFETLKFMTGVWPIDVLTGGGIPYGRFTVLTGDFSTLKSYVGLRAIAAVQKAGGVAALADTEHAYDPEWAHDLGVDTKRLILIQEESAEEALDQCEVAIRNKIDLIVFDSVAAAQPQAHSSKRLYGENIQPARQAALMSEACRRLTSVNSRTAVMWINQLREDIGGMTFGPREKATGGRALPYYASYIIRLKKVGKVTKETKRWDGEVMKASKIVIAQKFKAELEKSKLSAPFTEEWFTWDLKTGEIDDAGYLIGLGLEHGLVRKKGNTWSFGKQSAVGKEKFHDVIAANPDGLMKKVMPLVLPEASVLHNGGKKRLRPKKASHRGDLGRAKKKV